MNCSTSLNFGHVQRIILQNSRKYGGVPLQHEQCLPDSIYFQNDSLDEGFLADMRTLLEKTYESTFGLVCKEGFYGGYRQRWYTPKGFINQVSWRCGSTYQAMRGLLNRKWGPRVQRLVPKPSSIVSFLLPPSQFSHRNLRFGHRLTIRTHRGIAGEGLNYVSAPHDSSEVVRGLRDR